MKVIFFSPNIVSIGKETYNSIELVSWLKVLQTHRPVP